MRRRTFIAGVGAVALSGAVWQEAARAAAGESPYGPLGAADGNGVAFAVL
ncbi:MAG: translocation protein TolB, partial [Nonomuraea sp.]|nr:translocation protein TolB [Nonomuraea sp.]